MKNAKKTVLPLLSMVMVSLYPSCFMFFQNAGEARPIDILPFFLIFLFTAVVIMLMVLAVLRNLSAAALIADLATLAVINFNMAGKAIKEIIPGFRDMILLAVIGLILIGLMILFFRKKPDLTILCGLVSLMFGVMIIMNAVPAVPTLVSMANFQRSQPEEEKEIRQQVFSGEKRNVYYMVFDEYGGPQNLNHYFNCENEEFWSGLKERGFSVSETSKNTESAWTVTLVPNLMNLRYATSDEFPINNRLEWLKDPAIYGLFRNNGYQINLVNQLGFLDENNCLVLTQKQTDETISDLIYENTVFRLIPKLNWTIERFILKRQARDPKVGLDDARDAMIDCWKAAAEGPTLTICYIAAPHAPFLFHADGSRTRQEEFYDWTQPELYLAKLEYISPAILSAVDNIQSHDPDAVIILQADHGARVPGNLVYYIGGPWFDADVEIPYMENVLNAVYVPGGSPDIEGLNGINTVRKTIDEVFSTDLGQLEAPDDYTIPKEYMPPPPEE